MANGRLLLGLDIGSSGAKICQLRELRGSYEVQLVDSAEFSNDAIVDGSILDRDSVVNAIKQMLQRNNIRQRPCAIAISGYSVIVKRVRMPEMSDDELRDNLRWEVEQHIPYDYDDVVVDTVILERNSAQKKMEILLVASKKEVVSEYMSIAKSAGLDVKVVDTVSFALHNMAETVYKDLITDSVIAIINVGASLTSMTMVTNGVPAFTRDIQIGGNQITEEIQKKLGITREEADNFKTGAGGSASAVVPQEVESVTQLVSENIAGEIRRSINFFYETTGMDHIDHVLLCGGAIKNPTTCQALKKALDAKCTLVNPFEKLAFNTKLYTSQALDERGLELAVAFGLALRSANE